MRRAARRTAAVLVPAVALTLAACSSPDSPGSPGSSSSSPTPAPSSPSGASASPSGSFPTAPAPLVGSRLAVPAGLRAAPFDVPRTVRAPAGWQVSLWARLPGARLAAWTPDGALLVSRPGAGDVVALTPSSGGNPPSIRTLVAGLTQPHGLAFDGPTLYVAESDALAAYTYSGGRLSNRRVIVTGLPDAKSPELGGRYAHALKSVAVGRDGWIYFSIGSVGNVSEQDRDANPQRASILRVRPSGGTPEVFARGVRNGSGLAVAPDGAVWTAVNNRDNVAYPYARDYDGDETPDRGRVIQRYVNDHPLEPLARLTAGRDLGWPYCNPDPDVAPGVRTTAFTYTNRPFVRDVQTNPDGAKLDCSTLPPVEQGLPAHSAPLGLSFVATDALPAPFGQGALVGVHGSWNRTPPREPEVAFFPWRDGTLGPQQTLLSGFQAPDGGRWGRPVMAVPGPDGAIYVTDDGAGAVYRMSYTG